MKKIVLLLAFFAIGLQVLMAQTKEITGKVTSSEDGGAIPGVTVSVKGTTMGTITNMDGVFTLKVPQDSKTLVVSFVGMTSQEVTIGSQSTINVQLSPDLVAVDEVVVTALGVSREKKSLGYSVQDVKGNELAQAKENNVINSLSGKVSGVQITNSSGAVGSSSRIIIRGASSLGGNQQPLFIVDGVAISNSEFSSGTVDGNGGVNRGNGAGDINPDDIESVSVLKGPNAAALYGSQAANGAILITTKAGSLSGKNKKSGLGIEVGNSTTFENPLRLPSFQNGYGQGAEGQFSYVDGAGGGVKDGVDESWGPKLDAGLMIPQYDSPVENGVRKATPWVSHPNNVKDFLDQGVTSTTNVAVTGGNKDANFRISYTNLGQKGMLPNTNYKKNTVAIGGSANATDKLSISGTATYVMTESDNQPGGGYDAQNVFQQFMWAARQVNYPDLKNYTNPDGSKYNWNYNFHNNPYFTLYENTNTMNRERLYGNAKVNYKILDNLSAFIRTGIDQYSNLNTSRSAWGDNDNPFGYYNEYMSKNVLITNDFLLMFNQEINTDLTLTANFGGSSQTRNYHQTFGAADELAVEGVYTIANAKVPIRSTSYQLNKKINSFYGSAQLGYKNALFLDITGRNDWSSTLPSNSNSFFYPSVSVSSVLTDLLDWKSETLSYAKVRAGWAKVGSDTDPYSLSPTLSFGDGWNSSTKYLNQFVPNDLPNANLKPQFANSLEFGADLKFFNNRVGLDLTYYDQKTTDQIISIPISASSGYTKKYINAGEIDNKGIEVTLNLGIIQAANGFNWNMNVNFAKNKNEVVELAPDVEQFELGTYWDLKVVAIPGQPYGSLYGADFLRDPSGNIINRGGVPVKGDLKILGNYQPDWIGGINNEFNYKNLSASFLIDIHQGGEIYSMTNAWGRYAGALEESLIGREGGITGVGVKEVTDASGKVTYLPNDVVVTAEEYNHAAFSNSIPAGSIFDASYVKLREVRIAYSIKKLGNLPIKALNLALIGRNLAILSSSIPHVDPETSFNSGNAQGLEFGQLPSARSIGFNINLEF